MRGSTRNARLDWMQSFWRQLFSPTCILALSCASPKRYVLRSELPILEGRVDLLVAPGPWRHTEVTHRGFGYPGRSG
jgi:hypothetical protein